MSVTFDHQRSENGISVTRIKDRKFKSNIITVRFIMPLDEKKSPRNALTMSLLATSNSIYRSRELLTEAVGELYGAHINSFSYRISDFQVCGLSLNHIGDEYTIGKEKISDKAAEILKCCLFSPHFENGMFSGKYFQLRRQDQLDTIKSLVNDKRQYALIKAYRSVFEGEPISISTLGTIEEVESIQLSELNDSYEDMLKNAAVSISSCGGDIPEDICAMLLDCFAKYNPDRPAADKFLRPSQLKDRVCIGEERMDVNQCKLIMAYKTETSNIYADKVMCALLGGSPISKLFENVREKLSLCYYCASGLIEGKNTMIIDSGLDEDKLETAKSEISRQLEAVQNGSFTDEELENIKLFVSGAFRSNYDSVSDIESWYYYQFIRGTAYSPDDVCEIIANITREDVIQSAKGFKLDTVFTLKPLNGGEPQ